MDFYIIEHVLVIVLIVSNVIAWKWRPFREGETPSIGTLMRHIKPRRPPTLDAADFAVLHPKVQHDGDLQRDRRYQ